VAAGKLIMKVDCREFTVVPSSSTNDVEVSELTVAQLVGKVYDEAPPAERGHLLEPLLRSLGVLSLAAVANGVFAKMRFRSGLQGLVVRPDDVQNVRSSDVVALVDHIQKAGVDAIDRLGPTLMASPAIAGCAAAALLVAILVQRMQGRREPASRDDHPDS
jgi:hypothetical protein